MDIVSKQQNDNKKYNKKKRRKGKLDVENLKLFYMENHMSENRAHAE